MDVSARASRQLFNGGGMEKEFETTVIEREELADELRDRSRKGWDAFQIIPIRTQHLIDYGEDVSKVQEYEIVWVKRGK
jgi:hypothetical protein